MKVAQFESMLPGDKAVRKACDKRLAAVRLGDSMLSLSLGYYVTVGYNVPKPCT